MRIHVAVGVAVLAVLILAWAVPTDDTIEVIWASLGAGGSVYAAHVWKRRRNADEWRKRLRMNGSFALTTQTHATLRGFGVGAELLILISGVGAMLNWHRFVIIGSLIALAALLTISAWYAERAAERQEQYYLTHKEDV